MMDYIIESKKQAINIEQSNESEKRKADRILMYREKLQCKEEK